MTTSSESGSTPNSSLTKTPRLVSERRTPKAQGSRTNPLGNPARRPASQRGVTYAEPRRLITGVLYYRASDAWILGDVVVTDTHLLFDGPSAATRFSLPLHLVTEVAIPPMLLAGFERFVLVLKLADGQVANFRALDSLQLADYFDTIDDVINGDYPGNMPATCIKHLLPPRSTLPTTTPLQTTLMEAAKAKAPRPPPESGNEVTCSTR